MRHLKSLLSNWPAVSLRLDAALALPPADRAAWVAALPEPEAFRQALRELLDSGGGGTARALDAGPVLDSDALDDAAAAAADQDQALCAGMQVGPYRLLRPLGHGGMGVVWLAEGDEDHLKRTVALKLPRLGWSDGLHDRMRRERDILASLAHPHIARIHDAGVDAAGRPYLALEPVEGEPIDRYCRERQLPTEQRLQLLLQTARAVAHAHARLVVHRDLKPSNIFVTTAGEVRLLDFGIAQFLDGERAVESPLTQRLGHVLTLDYASPEQLRGQPIGTASDVYSLAVVAFEVLTERKPYRLKRPTAAALEEAIIAIDVPSCSSAAADPAARRALRGDVDAIINRALKKEERERYPSVEAFARDIERHLAKLPVSARPDSWSYRLRRFVVRNGLAVSAGGAVALALVAGTAVATWQARQARAEALRAEQVKRFALSIVNGTNLESGASGQTSAVDLLQAAKARVDVELAGNPATAVELLIAVGTGLQSQGRVADATALLLSTRDRALRTLGQRDPLTLAADIAYGLALVGSDRPQEAIAVLAPAASAAAARGERQATVDALINLSTAQLAAAQGEAGVASARAAVAALQMGPAASPSDAFNAWGQLANALNATQQPGLAQAAGQAVQFARQLYGEQPTGDALSARLLLSRGLSAEGRDTEALAELEAVYATALRQFGPLQPRIEAIANFLGLARADAGDLDGAVAAFSAALAVAERVQGGTGGNRGIDHFTLGRALAAQRRDSEALAHLTQSVRLLSASVGAATPQTLRSRSVQAAVLTRLGRLDEADRIFTAIAAATWPPAEGAQNELRLALLRSRQGRHAEAAERANRAREALQGHPSKIVRAAAAATLGQVMLQAGRPEEALPPWREASRLYAERQTRMTPDRAEADAALALAAKAAAGAQRKPI